MEDVFAGVPQDLRVILSEIEKEAIPDRLLDLARQLQDALSRRNARAVGK